MRPELPWEFNILNIYNFHESGPYEAIFHFLSEKQQVLKGNILEAGVYRGRMTLSLALFLKSNNLEGVIHGFDTFAGFPHIAPEDDIGRFQDLFRAKKIKEDHFQQILLLQKYMQNLVKRGTRADEISSSGAFTDSKFAELIEKIRYFDLDNIQLHEGPFEKTMRSDVASNITYSLIFVDCDLYQGYLETLRYGWPRLLSGGMVFLDEYYSLKFPGPRIAVDEFLARIQDYDLMNVAKPGDDFERWVIVKK
jgi:hypothetical protein